MITSFLVILYLIFGYLIGSIFISYPWGLLRGIDITKNGTGQLGGSNAGRLLGWYVMIIAGLFDVLKALIPLVITNYINNKLLTIDQIINEVSLIAVSIGILLGHAYSIYLKFYTKRWQGGKGVASYGGILLFISWQSFIIIYPVLFGLLSLGKKLLKTKLTIYDNFYNNAVLLLLSPFIVYFFVPELWISIWLIILIFLFIFFDRNKVIAIFTNVKVNAT